MPDQEPTLRGLHHLLPAQGGALPANRDLRAAIAAFSEQLQRNPHDVRALHGRGAALIMKAARGGENAPAAARQSESDFAELARLQPELAQAWEGRASARFHRAQLERRPRERRESLLREAIEDFGEALKRAPGATGLLMARGLATVSLAAQLAESPEALDLWPKAIADYDAVVSAEPLLPEAWSGRACARLGIGQAALRDGRNAIPDFEAGVADYEKAVLLRKGASGTVARLAVARAHLALLRGPAGAGPSAEFQRALREIASIREFGPIELEALEQITGIVEQCAEASKGPMRGVILACLYQHRAATAHARHADPAPDLEKALAATEDALRYAPEAPELLYLRAQALAVVGRRPEAIRDLEEALSRAPGLQLAKELLELLRRDAGSNP